MAAITETERAAMERNLRILPWWWVARWIWLGEAIWVVYLLRDRGLTIGEVIVFTTAMAAVGVAAEMPTGVVADRYGRRISMVVASVLGTLAFAAFGLATSKPLLLGSFALFGIADAFMSGADNAFIFDTLQRLGRGDEFTRRVGRMNGIQTAAVAVFTVLGGLMIRWTPLSWPIVLSSVTTIPAIGLALALKEPPREGPRLSFLRTASEATRGILRVPSMRAIVLLTTFASMPIIIMDVTWQPVVLDYGVPLWTLGLFSGTQLALSSAGALSSARIGRSLGMRRMMLTMGTLGAVAIFGGAAGLIWLFPLFILPSVTWNVIHPHVADYLSRRTTANERATTLSLGTLSERLAMIPLTLLLAAAVDRWGLHGALWAAGAALFLLVLASYFEWARSGDTEVEPATPVE